MLDFFFMAFCIFRLALSRSSVYNIRYSTDPYSVPRHQMLDSWVQSNELAFLTNDFPIKIKVLSLEHYHFKAQTGSEPHIVGEDVTKSKYPNFVLSWPKCCKDQQKHCFTRMCLLTCLIFVSLKSEDQHLYDSILLEINGKTKKFRRKAAQKMHSLFDKFFMENPAVLQNGPYKINFLCNILANLYNIQVHFFNHDLGTSNIQSFPKEIDFFRQQAYFCIFGNHMTVIKNIILFVGHSRLIFVFPVAKIFEALKALDITVHILKHAVFVYDPFLRKNLLLIVPFSFVSLRKVTIIPKNVTNVGKLSPPKIAMKITMLFALEV